MIEKDWLAIYDKRQVQLLGSAESWPWHTLLTGNEERNMRFIIMEISGSSSALAGRLVLVREGIHFAVTEANGGVVLEVANAVLALPQGVV